MNTKELAEKLELHPELKARFEELVSIVENKSGDLELADVAEQRVIDEMRKLGQTALQDWANRQSNRASERFKTQQKALQKHSKKKYFGIQPMEK